MNKLHGKRIAVFDLEIKKRIEDCSRGWESHDEMGISVLVIYDYLTGRYRIFDDVNQAEAKDILNNYDIISGYNIVKFDWKVVNSSWGGQANRKSKDFDILREIWISSGLDPDNFVGRTHGNLKLDDVAFDTIGMRKIANGALAPIMYQEHRFADLVDYCLEDVRIEKTLFEFAIQHRYVVRNGVVIPLNIPQSLK